MPQSPILIVAVDGLRASALGAYGNTAFPTPALDELAAQSFLMDLCYAPCAELPAIYRALWESVHPLRADDYASGAALARVLREHGYESTLVTDAADVAALASGAGFDQCICVDAEVARRAEEVPRTALARLFAEACDVVSAPRGASPFVWIHAGGMYGPWDAPLEIQAALLDEGDPPPVETVEPPDRSISQADDPDTAFRYSVAYAAQVVVLDECWAALRDAMAEVGKSDEWLILLLGVRGFPLGEHRHVGGVDPRLYSEQLHVPWLMRFPDRAGRLARCGQLVSSLDVLPSLVDWMNGSEGTDTRLRDGTSLLPLVQTANAPWREVLVFGSRATGDRAIRTPVWTLRYEVPNDAARASRSELFVRPDDRWEANDVAALCPDVVDGLVNASEEMAARIVAGEAMQAAALAEELRLSAG